mmetsp:Transcript_111773/g.219112  ORF Transcript_111773/g.219112 Transcript_111773/m.219112 type:complete len:293 (+) Transcript_111773:1-879(+)
MAAVAILRALFGEGEPRTKKQGGLPTPNEVMVAYGLFAGLAFAVYHYIAEGEFSAIVTMAVMFQCLSMVLLCMQSFLSGSSAGISVRALALEAFGLVCRLSSTLWLNGYLPVDASGDWAYQAFDICSLFLIVGLILRVLTVQQATYQSEEDSLSIGPIVLASFVLAALLHGDMNLRPLFDALWMTGLFGSVLAPLPQLWLISQSKGKVQALTSHHIAMMAFSRMLSGIFMWYARHDISCEPWVGEVNHTVPAILCAHLVHLVLLGDFVYYYVKGVATGGLSVKLDMSSSDIV